MKTRHVSMILFYDSEGNILLQDRMKISKWGEKYGFFGGEIEEGETPEEAIKREVKEELGFDLVDFKFFKYFDMHLKDYGFKVSRHVFIAPMPNLQELNCLEGEPIKVKLKDYNKLEMPPGDPELLKEIHDYLLK